MAMGGFWVGEGLQCRRPGTRVCLVHFVAQKDRVARTALFQAPPDAFHLDTDTAVAQALLKFSILSSRPDGQHSAQLESSTSGGESAVIVEPNVVCRGKRGRSVVHIEEHGVERVAAGTERESDVTNFNPHALILQRMSRQRPQRTSVPLYDCRQKLGHHNSRVGWK